MKNKTRMAKRNNMTIEIKSKNKKENNRALTMKTKK